MRQLEHDAIHSIRTGFDAMEKSHQILCNITYKVRRQVLLIRPIMVHGTEC